MHISNWTFFFEFLLTVYSDRHFSYVLLQGHWRFPSGKEMIGYAYILTHPGTPSVFYDHIFSHYKTEIASLISLRKRNGIHCRSTVSICVPNLVLCKHFQGGRMRMNFFLIILKQNNVGSQHTIRVKPITQKSQCKMINDIP